MADNSSSQRSRRSFTPIQSSASAASSTRSSGGSQRLVSDSLQRPTSITSSESYFYADDLLRPPRLQHAESRFSLNEHFAASRREYDFEGDDYSFSESASLFRAGEGTVDLEDEGEDVMCGSYPDFYNLLGLSKETNPTTAQITTAFEWHKTSVGLNEDQQPPQLKAAIQKHSARLYYAHETLVHPQKRVVYDILGENGLRQEYSIGGIMGKGGEAERDIADIEAMSAEEFKYWFNWILAEKELDRQELLRSRGNWILESYSSLIWRDISGTVLKGSDRTLSTLLPVNLAVHQRFGIPLKRLGRLLLSYQIEGKPKRGKLSERDNYLTDKLDGSILVISGGVISSIDSQTRFPFGCFDTSQFLPSCSVQLHQTFPRVAASEENSLGSLLRDSRLDLSTNLWPQKRVSLGIGIGRHLTILDHTRPFYCYLQTTLQNNSIGNSPAIAIRVERPIDDNSSLYYQFISPNSCTSRPGVNPTCGSFFGSFPFDVNPVADVGYFWARSRPNLNRYQPPYQHTDADLIIGHENLSSSSSPEGHLSCTVTTVSAYLSAKYAFRILGESFTSSALPEKQSQSMKIEMAAYLQDNLTYTGLVQVLQNFGASTFGVGLAVKPGTGLFLTFSYSRWGQSLYLPVFIVPLHPEESTWALIALAIPYAVSVLVEAAVLRSRRRRKSQATEKKKRELSNQGEDTNDPE